MPRKKNDCLTCVHINLITGTAYSDLEAMVAESTEKKNPFHI